MSCTKFRFVQIAFHAINPSFVVLWLYNLNNFFLLYPFVECYVHIIEDRSSEVKKRIGGKGGKPLLRVEDSFIVLFSQWLLRACLRWYSGPIPWFGCLSEASPLIWMFVCLRPAPYFECPISGKNARYMLEAASPWQTLSLPYTIEQCRVGLVWFVKDSCHFPQALW